MNILFVEVRDKTRLFAAVAHRLMDQHHISWIVQNHAFNHALPGTVWQMPYGKRAFRAASSFLSDRQVAMVLYDVAALDRFWYRFGHATEVSLCEHVHAVAGFMAQQAPEVCIGEIGNFQSLIVSGICKIMGIPFLNPITCRYPTQRFCFYLYDRMLPLLGSEEQWPRERIENWSAIIAGDKRKPDYMSLSPSKTEMVSYRLKLLREWMLGERLATQNPWSNLAEKRRIRRNLKRWDRLAEQRFNEQALSHSILYPLQMQPELNLDVWGREFRDQPGVIRNLLDRYEGPLLIKTNPKSFFEMSDTLVELVEADPRVIPAPRNLSMTHCQRLADLTVTVTGTVAIESIIKGLPVEILSGDYRNLLGVENDDTLIGRHRSELGHRVLQRLIRLSYPGTIGEPLLTPSVLETSNIEMLAASFDSLLASLAQGWHWPEQFGQVPTEPHSGGDTHAVR